MGIERKGKLIFREKNGNEKLDILALSEDDIKNIRQEENAAEKLIAAEEIPSITDIRKCKKCAYRDFCFGKG